MCGGGGVVTHSNVIIDLPQGLAVSIFGEFRPYSALPASSPSNFYTLSPLRARYRVFILATPLAVDVGGAGRAACYCDVMGRIFEVRR